MDAEVTLVIKSANQAFIDHKVEYHDEWTVLDLKREISKTHPGIPSVLEQRLIYSGQLLQDPLTLKEVLRHPPENNAYTIHMVSSNSKKPPVTNKSDVQSKDGSALQSPVSLPQPEVIPDSTTDGIRRRVITSESSPVIQPQGLDSPALYPHFSQVPSTIQGISDPLQQMAAMQQMYAQYMASYMQYMQTPQEMSQGGNSYIGANSDSASDQSNLPQPPQLIPNNPQPQQVVPNRVAAPQVANQVQDEEEDGVPRDWLDYVYYASRMGVLLSIVYFYSTFTRFVLIIVIFFGFYLYQSGWFLLNAGGARAGADNNNQDVQQQPMRAQPEPERDEAVRRPDPIPGPGPGLGENRGSQGDQSAAPQDHHPEASPDEERTSSAATSRDDSEGAVDREETVVSDNSTSDDVSGERDVISEELMSQRPSILTLSWTFLTTFFTSLIPENNQIIA